MASASIIRPAGSHEQFTYHTSYTIKSAGFFYGLTLAVSGAFHIAVDGSKDGVAWLSPPGVPPAAHLTASRREGVCLLLS